MRAFIIFTSLVVVANAAHLGYNYQTTNAQVSQGAYNTGAYGSQGSSLGGGYSPFSQNHGSNNGDYSGPVNHGSAAGHGHAGASSPDYQKEFYSFSAPEHEFDDNHNTEDFASELKKNLRVIFIKGPENSGLENAALQLAKSAGDQQTAIYVLTKQADLSGLANKLRNENSQSHSKPEVHFVKYRTPEDAEHAKQAIQSQYENLPGSTSSHDGGVAPVHDYASSPQKSLTSTPEISPNAYLPANLRV